jgi:teichuronic acid exporter
VQIERQAATALKWNTAAKLLSQTFSWAVTLIVLRLLLPEHYGLAAISAVIVSIVAGMAEFGLGSALIQVQNLSRNELARVAGALGTLNVVCGAAVALAAPWLAGLFSEPRLEWVIRAASLQFLLYALDVVPQSLMQREMRFKAIAGIELAAAVCGSGATLTLALLDAGVWSLVFGNLAGATVRTGLLLGFGTFVRPSLRFAGIGRHVRFGSQVTASRFLWQLAYQLDTLIAARFLSREAVGFYSVSMHLATLPMNKSMGIVNQVAFPAVARLQDELPRLRARLLEALRLLAFVAIPALWGLSAVALEFVDVVLGSQWHAAVLPLQLVSLVAPARMLMAVFATATDAIGRAGLELGNTIIGAIVLPVAFLIGVRFGLNGLAASWLIAIPLLLAINVRRTCGALGLTGRSVFSASRAPLIAGMVLYAAVSLVRLALSDMEEAPRLPILIAVGAIAYVLAIQLVDRAIWTDARRLVAALRG